MKDKKITGASTWALHPFYLTEIQIVHCVYAAHLKI